MRKHAQTLRRHTHTDDARMAGDIGAPTQRATAWGGRQTQHARCDWARELNLGATPNQYPAPLSI
eukprot:907191-Alexandrium_andersonii.AAC.1